MGIPFQSWEEGWREWAHHEQTDAKPFFLTGKATNSANTGTCANKDNERLA